MIFFIFFALLSGYYFKRIYQPWGTCDTDFTVFTQAATHLAKGQEIYQTSFLETGRDYYKYSPLFAIMMIPLSKLHKHLAVPIWFFSIFLFFAGSIFFNIKILDHDHKNKDYAKWFYALVILTSLRFLLGVVQRVQSDALVLFLLSGFILLLFLRKDIGAGIALASACMVKLTPLIFIPYLLIRKKIKAALACTGAILFYLFIPAIVVGMGKNLEYLHNWFLVHQKNPFDYIIWYKNQSLFSCLSRMFSADSFIDLSQAQIFLIFLFLACGLFSLILILSRKQTAPQTGFSFLVEISGVLICMILFSPLAWKHSFIHLTIVHLVLLYYLFYLNPNDRLVKILFIASFMLNSALNPETTKPFADLIQRYSNITLGTLLLYAAIVRILALNPYLKQNRASNSLP